MRQSARPQFGSRPRPKRIAAHPLGVSDGRETALRDCVDEARRLLDGIGGCNRLASVAPRPWLSLAGPCERGRSWIAAAPFRSFLDRDPLHVAVPWPLGLRLGRLAQILVPLDILRRTADLDDVRKPVSIDVGDLATGGGHSHRVEILMQPFGPAVIL